MPEATTSKNVKVILSCIGVVFALGIAFFTYVGKEYAASKLTAPLMASLCSENDACLTVLRNHYERCFHDNFQKAIPRGQRSKLYAYDFVACLNYTSDTHFFSESDVHKSLNQSSDVILYSVLTHRWRDRSYVALFRRQALVMLALPDSMFLIF